MNGEEAKATFRGPMVSVATPMTDDDQLDLDTLCENIQFMLDHGIRHGRGVLLVGAAGGEFPMLTMEERKHVVRASVEAADGQVPVVPSIQFNSVRDVVELASYAVEHGAAMGQLSAPFYYNPAPIGDIVALFRAAAGTGLPVMIYNNWWNTRHMNPESIERLSEIPNVVALKWSAPGSGQYTQGLQRFADRLAIIDNELQYVWPHMMGAVGFITHVGNFWPEYILEIWDLLESRQYDAVASKLAQFKWGWREWTHRVQQETEGEGPFIKAAMEEVGLRAGPPRPPAQPVSEHLRKELRVLMAEAGVPRAR
jgi:dihydrodipicolinate synthase/N-acetylneuraminate lyase